MALNDEEQALSTLGQPIVTPLTPAATPSAVEQLIDAYHKGFITTNDILAHSGALAAEQGKNALDVLKIQPDIIQAQKAQANLTTSQAQAQQAMVQPLAQLQQTQVTRATADVNSKQALDAYYAMGLPPVYTKDGALDNVAMTQHGGKILQATQQYKIANDAFAGAQWTQQWDEKAGKLVNVFMSPTGLNLTPPRGSFPGSTEWQHYSKMQQNAREFLSDPNNLPGPSGVPSEAQPKVPQSSAVPVDEPPAPMATAIQPVAAPVVSPLPAGLSAAAGNSTASRSAFIQPATTTITHPDGTTIQQTAAAPVSPVAGQTAAPLPPVPVSAVQPAGAGAGNADSWPVPPRFDVAQKIMGDVRAQEPVKNWLEKHPAINRMRAIAATPPTGITTQDDLDLANSVAQLVSQSSGVRGTGDLAQAHKIEETVPLLERVANLKGIVLKEHAFPPEVRQRLIAVGERAARSLETDARAAYAGSLANLRWQAALPDEYLPSVLNTTEMGLLRGPATSAAPAARTFTLSSGRKVVVGGTPGQ